jgi:radical SAM family RiPP maturation amino acid epimerase
MNAIAKSDGNLAVDPKLSIGQVKRVLEWWSSSEPFRQLIDENPEEAARRYDLGFNPQVIRALWDPFFEREAREQGLPVHPAVGAYIRFFNDKTIWRGEVKAECTPSDPRFKAWRARQISRNVMENGGYDDYIIHTPLAIEITEGCSVQCWFCGVGASKMASSFLYTAKNATLWRECLTVLHDKIGSAAKWGFLYWATDPLDNPDYEYLASDFCDIMGMYPQTTTAQAHKHVERVRALLRESEARGCRVNRFSVLTEPLLRRIYRAFTADELTNVEIVAQMKDATTAKAAAGAFLERARVNRQLIDTENRKLEKLAETSDRLVGRVETKAPPQPGTIACVSGFLLNIVTRTVKLISPCRASETWPLGYIVFDEKTFSSAKELEHHVETMMAEHMPLTISLEDRIRFNPKFRYQKRADGFHIISDMNELAFCRTDMADYVVALGDQVDAGHRTAAQIAFAAFFEHGIPEANTIGTLEAMFQRGLLVDARGRICGERAA